MIIWRKIGLIGMTMLSFTLLFNTLAYGMEFPYKTELIIRTPQNFKSPNDVVKFFEMAARNKVSVVTMSVKQDEDHEYMSGTAFYQSKIAPIASGYENFDVLKLAIEEAHKHNIKLRAWIPQFHDQVAFKKNPSWAMQALQKGKVSPYKGANGNEYFVNPGNVDVQKYERSIIQEVLQNYEVDGIVLDWVRFDDYQMDLSQATRNDFKKKYGYDPIKINFSKNNAKRTQWNDYRTTIIGNYITSVRDVVNKIKPTATLGAYVLAPEFYECGQDIRKFKDAVDYVAPMAYYTDWGYPIDWLWREDGILKDARRNMGTTSKPLLPVFDIFYSDSDHQLIYSQLRSQFPEIQTLSFFKYGGWTEDEVVGIQNRIDN